MGLREVRIDDRTWDSGDEARREEWRSAIHQFLAPDVLEIREDAACLQVTVTEQAILLSARGTDDDLLAQVDIPHDVLADHVREYVDIVRQLAHTDARGGGLARLEALDMAKKVAHDRAGRTLKRQCRPFGVGHETARRLYTLLLTLRVDTTRLVGVHGHRRIR